MQSDLSDLVDFPRETLEIELKEWLDLEEPVAKAKIARHIAALANHGGGYLVFGFRDDLSVADNRPPDLKQFTRDRLTAIARRYLHPGLQCDVAIVAASNGMDYPVVGFRAMEQRPSLPRLTARATPKGDRRASHPAFIMFANLGPKAPRLQAPTTGTHWFAGACCMIVLRS